MDKVKKLTIILFIVALIASNLTIVNAVSEQSIPKPSVPIFSLTFTDYSYDVPAGTTYSGYTGPTYEPAHRERNGTIEVTIVNQPFTPYMDESNRTINLYYHWACKGHYEDYWIIHPYRAYSKASNSEKTTLLLFINEAWENPSKTSPDVPDDGKIDVKVEAFIGYSETLCTSIAGRVDDYNTFYTGQLSGWSNVQTITVNENASTPTPIPNTAFGENPNPPSQNPSTPATPIETPKPNTTQPVTQTDISLGLNWEQVTIATMAVTIVVLASALVFSLKRKPKGTF